MAQTVDELSFEYRDEEGQLLRRELDKVVLSKGAWATIMYLYQDLDRASKTYKAPKVAIVRYRKSRGVYRKQTSFNISSERQGRMIMEVLERWYSTADELADKKATAKAAPVESETQDSEPDQQEAPAGSASTPEVPTPTQTEAASDTALPTQARASTQGESSGAAEASESLTLSEPHAQVSSTMPSSVDSETVPEPPSRGPVL